MQIHTTPCEFLLIQSAKRHSEFTGVSHLDTIPSFLISSSYPPDFFCHLGIVFEVEEVGANRNLFHVFLVCGIAKFRRFGWLPRISSRWDGIHLPITSIIIGDEGETVRWG